MASIKENYRNLLDERKAAWEKDGAPLAEIAAARDFTPDETRRFDDAESTFLAYSARLKALDNTMEQERQIAEFSEQLAGGEQRVAPGTTWINTDTGREASLRSNQSFLSHPAARSRDDSGDGALAQYGNLGEMVRALATAGTGSAVVPTTWSGQLIDLARSKSAVAQAGATIVPMNAKTVNIGRLTGDPTAAFRAESSAITASDPTFDNVTLSAKTQSALVKGSLEWFQDADNAESVVVNAMAQAIASNLDLNALYGGITAGAGTISLATPPNPRGILAALTATKAANVIGGATNGTAQTTGSYWSEILDLIYTVLNGNETPNALIWSSKLAQQYSKATDTTGQPLKRPSDVEDLSRFVVNRIPSYTQGTMVNRASDAFAGDWSQLLIGQRLGITLQVLNERFADTGEIGIVAHWRGDIQPARPGAFAVYRSLQAAA
ncbi:phage major capsid protein [Lacisediminihabitans changchengi]|uniref:Phage major capsid protein n=1 Tax=Lacisediminihabitans changchengi TaxID=2787634 RepID=A0A934SKY4_9MICO|nr:phage major capsid protein [Lacisediminihabitans changchengi]MBK4347245.1 phage major capsid protein [Lacisediminihabitans changchengi]